MERSPGINLDKFANQAFSKFHVDVADAAALT